MATNVYAPKDCDLTGFGFRWCNKDQRWERRKVMEDGDAIFLANQIGYKVEAIHRDGSTFTHHPDVDKDMERADTIDELQED